MAALRQRPIADTLFGDVTIRTDGRAVHAMYQFRCKPAAASTGEWDLYEPVTTIDAEAAFRPLRDGGCPLVTKLP